MPPARSLVNFGHPELVARLGKPPKRFDGLPPSSTYVPCPLATELRAPQREATRPPPSPICPSRTQESGNLVRGDHRVPQFPLDN